MGINLSNVDANISDNEYFAAQEDILPYLKHRIRNYYMFIQSSGIQAVWLQSYRAYYGCDLTNNSLWFSGLSFESIAMTNSGAQGELTNIKVNEYRSLLRNLINLTTMQMPAMEPIATNTSMDSISQQKIASGILDDYMETKGFAKKSKAGVETAIIFSMAAFYNPWNFCAGKQIDVTEDGRPIYEGDNDFHILSPLDFAYQINANEDDSMRDWMAVRICRNKWDLIARNPNEADAIKRAPSIDQDPLRPTYSESFYFTMIYNSNPTDYVWEWAFYHKKTPALPHGRMVTFVGDVKLSDSKFPFDNYPIKIMRCESLKNTTFGWSIAFDMLAVQHGIDLLNNTVMSNNASFGVQNVHVRKNDVPAITEFSGMRLFECEYSPEPIQLTKSAPESYSYLESLSGKLSMLSGVNSTVLGNPPTGVTAASALALMVSQAVTFVSFLESSWFDAIAEMAMTCINNIRKFATEERIINVVGPGNRGFVHTFKSADLEGVQRILCQPINPLMKTVIGRTDLADKLMQMGQLDSPQDYISVITTGQVKQTYSNKEAQTMLIEAENEQILNGEVPRILKCDNHPYHIIKHLEPLNSPESRKDPKAMWAGMKHLQDHFDLWKGMDPAELQALGYPILQQPMAPPGPPPPGGPPPKPPKKGAGGTMAPPQPGAPGPEKMPGLPGLPGLPPNTDPLSAGSYEQLTGKPQK